MSYSAELRKSTEFDLMGNLEEIFKLPTKINSNLVFINNSILYLDNKNKLVILG